MYRVVALTEARRRRRSEDEEVQVSADCDHRIVADPAQLPAGSITGHGPHRLGHSVRDLFQAGAIIGGDLDMVLKSAISACQRDGDKESWHCRVARMGNHHDRTYAALLASCDWVQVADQHVAAGHELYSGYSSAALEARPPRSAPVHSAVSAR